MWVKDKDYSEMNILELQDKFVVELLRPIKSRWDTIQVHYENMTVDGNNREIYTAMQIVDGERNQFNPTLEALDLLLELKKCKPNGQADEWTWLEFTAENTGKYKFDFMYDLPPHIATALKYSK